MKFREELKRVTDWFFDLQQRSYGGKILIMFPCNNDAMPTKFDNEFLSLFFDKETKRYTYERPDGYILTKRFGIITEHFQVDLSKHTSDGSLIRQGKVNPKNLKESISAGKVSFELLAENIKNTYINHLRNIPAYKKHLGESKTYSRKNKICFIIEDTSKYGEVEDENIIFELSKRIAVALSQIEKPVAYNFYMFIAGGKPQLIFARAEEIIGLARRIRLAQTTSVLTS